MKTHFLYREYAKITACGRVPMCAHSTVNTSIDWEEIDCGRCMITYVYKWAKFDKQLTLPLFEGLKAKPSPVVDVNEIEESP